MINSFRRYFSHYESTITLDNEKEKSDIKHRSIFSRTERLFDMIKYILVVLAIFAVACSSEKLPENKTEAPVVEKAETKDATPVVKVETKNATPVVKVEASMTMDATPVVKETKDATPIKK